MSGHRMTTVYRPAGEITVGTLVQHPGAILLEVAVVTGTEVRKDGLVWLTIDLVHSTVPVHHALHAALAKDALVAVVEVGP